MHSTNGVAVADYDRDGDLDVYFVAQGSYDANDSRTWNRLFANQGDGSFLPAPNTENLVGNDINTAPSSEMGFKLGASWGDYDNDGYPDLFLTHRGPNQLFRNNGDGTFTEVTQEAGVAGGSTQLSSSALWVDLDHDGDLDLYVSNWEDYNPRGTRNLTNWLYENLGDGTFAEVAEAAGLADPRPTWTTVALDVNNDGWLDLYLANDFGPNKLYLNNGDKTFTEATTAFGLDDPHHGMGVAITDCDNNGFFDIYLTNITETGFDAEINPLFLNTGANFFTHSSEEAGVARAGWGWGTEFFDLENDGDEDLFVVTGYRIPEYKNVLFRNGEAAGSFGFVNIAADVGLDDLTTARGLAVFDYDEDGDADLLISNFFDVPALYENPMGTGNWLSVKLEGTLSNRDAFGTIVEVEAGGQTFIRYHHGAQFLAQNIVPVHVGLGAATRVDGIRVRWPNGLVEEVGPVQVNQTISLRETEGLVDGLPTSADELPALESVLQGQGTYPNPFRERTTLRFVLNEPTPRAEVEIYNALGQRVHVMRKTGLTPGEHQFLWDGTDDHGQRLGAGIYFYRMRLPAHASSMQSVTGTLVFAR